MGYTDHFQALNRGLGEIEQAVRNIKSQVLSLSGLPEEDESTLEATRGLIVELCGLAEQLENVAVNSADELNDEYTD